MCLQAQHCNNLAVGNVSPTRNQSFHLTCDVRDVRNISSNLNQRATSNRASKCVSHNQNKGVSAFGYECESAGAKANISPRCFLRPAPTLHPHVSELESSLPLPIVFFLPPYVPNPTLPCIAVCTKFALPRCRRPFFQSMAASIQVPASTCAQGFTHQID